MSDADPVRGRRAARGPRSVRRPADGNANRDRTRPADRAVSSTLGYVLNIAIATMLVAGLFVAGADFVTDRQEQVIRTELRVVAQQVVADLEQADRLARAGRGPTTAVRIESRLPRTVAGSTYIVDVEPTSEMAVLVESTDPRVTVTVDVDPATPLGASTATGGRLVVTYDGTDLEVADD